MVDMPLNNHPTTVSQETLQLKVSVIDQLCGFELFKVLILFMGYIYLLMMNTTIKEIEGRVPSEIH